MRFPIYLDHNATTPVDDEVLAAMLPYFQQKFGNPASKTHAFGWDAEAAVGEARSQVADAIGCRTREVVFTSGATEANNLALLGVARRARARRAEPPPEIITTATEHKAVLDPCTALEKEGFVVRRLSPDSSGRVSAEQVTDAIGENTALVSILLANNETGVIQPIEEIGKATRAAGVPLHCDAAQAVGKIPVDLGKLPIDLLSISGHKVYGPKGIGALIVRSRPRPPIAPVIFGGGHESGLRSGTLATPLIVGLGRALERAEATREAEATRQRELIDRLLARLRAEVPDLVVHGVDREKEPEATLPGTVNLGFPGVEAEALLLGTPQLALSTGSACTSAELEPSHVLRAMGVPVALAHGSIRIGVGHSTRAEEVEFAAARLAEVAKRLRTG